MTFQHLRQARESRRDTRLPLPPALTPPSAHFHCHFHCDSAAATNIYNYIHVYVYVCMCYISEGVCVGRTTSRGCDPLCAFIPMLNTISPVVARGRQRSPPDLPALFAICSCSYASSPPLFVVAVVILCWLIIGPGYPSSCGAGWPSSFLLGSALSCSSA